ncbi:hypothetical protein [Methylobacterium tarhaniae]|uniref:hypothetical protein n=1 Tax=Methylobacterium tarhaniae TaxID=1187852 RepID=UPI0012EE0729|nr:hypothetical protein [Methylobacterium tarhaniae]
MTVAAPSARRDPQFGGDQRHSRAAEPVRKHYRDEIFRYSEHATGTATLMHCSRSWTDPGSMQTSIRPTSSTLINTILNLGTAEEFGQERSRTIRVRRWGSFSMIIGMIDIFAMRGLTSRIPSEGARLVWDRPDAALGAGESP